MSPPPLSHESTVDVAWGDCDPAGIVFYPRYFAWFDHATHRMLTAAGLDHHTLVERYGAVGLTLVDAGASFKRPATYGARLTLHSRVDRIGRSSLTVKHAIHDAGGLIVEGHETRVYAERNPEDGALRAAPIPDAVRRVLLGE
ncbi:MAG: acyl-CoA thioesterase [Myxococcales bacterium]|nr:acyl-CoA thioesterase [Myxococcales bacterium]